MSTQRTCVVTTTPLLQQQQFKDDVEEEKSHEIKVINLKAKAKKNVKWAEDTIDNENMNKLKSNGITLFSLKSN